MSGHPHSSVFHTPAWLEALRRTYGYDCVVYTTSPPAVALMDGVAFCRVDSWLTGRRLVSLPFSDHCEPLVDNVDDLAALYSTLEDELRQEKRSYFELRPLGVTSGTSSLFHSTRTYTFHWLDLRPDLATLFKNCHKASTQRKIQRAESAGLTYEEGRTEPLLNAFYRLLVMTRQRHCVPPPPKLWFQNLIDCLGEALKIRLASINGRPVASILTLLHKSTMTYKYGCSDARFHRYGGMQFLFWRSIQEAKREGLQVFDLGRSDSDQTGLITFKDRLGSMQTTLTYSRFSCSAHSHGNYSPAECDWQKRAAQRIVASLPNCLLPAIGRLVYRHVA